METSNTKTLSVSANVSLSISPKPHYGDWSRAVFAPVEEALRSQPKVLELHVLKSAYQALAERLKLEIDRLNREEEAIWGQIYNESLRKTGILAGSPIDFVQEREAHLPLVETNVTPLTVMSAPD